jgi:hypothetical protein
MPALEATVSRSQRHHSPPLGVVAIVFTALFCAGLYPVTYFGGMPYFPSPSASAQTIAAFFQARPAAAVLCAFLHFGAAIPLGIFTASIVSRLEFLGVRAAGPRIALFGGFATAFLMLSSASVLWAMARPMVAQDSALTVTLYYLGFAMGGPGYAVTLGLLMAGISVPLLFMRVTPRWIPILGLVLAVCGELSWLSLELRPATLLIPLTRFPGFIWMIAVGFALPKMAQQHTTGDTQ